MKTMLKSQVSFCFSGIAFAIVMPTTANPAQQASAPSLPVSYSAGIPAAPFHTVSTKTAAMPISLPASSGMKFVNTYIKNNDECLQVVRSRSEGPFMIIDSVLRHYGLPLELKYLAVIESELKLTALSRVGARGPWQLMPGTAHELGLKVSRCTDDRMNYHKSTIAAAKYLRDLHKEFGDWLLVLAAYNGGPRPVYRAINKSHSRSFWALQRYLPAESREHVKKFIATAYYFETAGNLNALQSTAQTVSQSTAQTVSQSTAQTVGSATPKNTAPKTTETANERFKRLMLESAKSLKQSNELLEMKN
jgi:hypothetical protein